MTLPTQHSDTVGDPVLAPLRVEDPGLALRVRKGLLALGYNGDAVQAAIAGYDASSGPFPATTPLGCLIRAFVLHTPTPEDEFRQQVGSGVFTLCEMAGLWERVAGGVVGSVMLMVDGKTFLLSDHAGARMGARAMHWVMGIGTSTMKLANSLERRPYGRVLDLCCGAGVQAFIAAPYAREVVAVDQNPRALNYGRFGAAMSKFSNISFRESDCYSAVAGEEFDAIVCNPPYVLTPDRKAYYRDGGLGGDRFAEQVLREAPRYLAEEGTAHVMCDVAAMDGKSSEERLRGWLDGCGCDVLAISAKPMDAATYARNWLRKDGLAEEEKRWVSSFWDLGITGVTNYLVVLRKRTAADSHWFRVESFGGEPVGHFGQQVARLIAGEDLLQAGDAAISAARMQVAADVRMVNAMRVEGGKWVGDSAKLRFAEGLTWEFRIDRETGEALARLDGRFPPGPARQMLRWGVLEPIAR